MVDSLTKKDKELVDLQIKIKNMMDKTENNVSPEGQEITDILKSEIHILSKEVAELKEGIIDKETVIKKHKQDLLDRSKDVSSKDAKIEDLTQVKETLDLKIQSLNSTFKNQEDLIEKFKSETEIGIRKKGKQIIEGRLNPERNNN